VKYIFTNGCFDVLHRGHYELLKYCRTLGYVVVGLNSDASVTRLKGKGRPVFSLEDRKFILESCKYVDEVIMFEEDTPYSLIKLIKPDIIVKGGDYSREEVVGNDICEVKIYEHVNGHSTTKVIEDIVNR
tara:strand:- start:5069 stop:5458 length:390 start_codon:yes stop_codon:yes gene_type:complete